MRTIRLIATPVIMLGLLGVLLCAASWGWRSLTAPLPSPPATPCQTIEVTTVTPISVTVHVYNGGFRSGLAGRVGEHLKTAGFAVARTGNTKERITTTVVRGNATDEPQLQLVASYLQNATIEHDGRIDGTVDVLVGTQFADFAPEPLAEYPVDSGTICVVPPPNPEDSPS